MCKRSITIEIKGVIYTNKRKERNKIRQKIYSIKKTGKQKRKKKKKETYMKAIAVLCCYKPSFLTLGVYRLMKKEKTFKLQRLAKHGVSNNICIWIVFFHTWTNILVLNHSNLFNSNCSSFCTLYTVYTNNLSTKHSRSLYTTISQQSILHSGAIVYFAIVSCFMKNKGFLFLGCFLFRVRVLLCLCLCLSPWLMDRVCVHG